LCVEIRNDTVAKKEYEDEIKQQKKRKTELEKLIRENEKWMSDFDRDVAPFQQRYQANIKEAEKVAIEAKKKSQAAIRRLVC
jgi:hypothetical protein